MNPRGRFSLLSYLPEDRIVVGFCDTPLVKVLLSLAETLVRDGCVRNSLDFYNELANRVRPWIPGGARERAGGPSIPIYQICSPAVRKLAAALAVSTSGVRLDRDNIAHLVLLLSTPSETVPSYLALLSHSVHLLEDKSRIERLLWCEQPGEARSLLAELERDSRPVTPEP